MGIDVEHLNLRGQNPPTKPPFATTIKPPETGHSFIRRLWQHDKIPMLSSKSHLTISYDAKHFLGNCLDCLAMRILFKEQIWRPEAAEWV